MNKKRLLIICSMLPLLAALIINCTKYFEVCKKVNEEKEAYPYLEDHCIYSAIAAKYSNYHKGDLDKKEEKRIEKALKRDSIFPAIINRLRQDPNCTFNDLYPAVRIYTHDENKILVCKFKDKGKSHFRHLYYTTKDGEFILKDSSLTAYTPDHDIKRHEVTYKSNGEPLLALTYSCMISEHYTYMYCILDVCKNKIIFNDVKNYDDGDGFGIFYYDMISRIYESKGNERVEEEEEEEEDLCKRLMIKTDYRLGAKYIDNYPVLIKRQKKTEQKGESITQSDTISFYKISETGAYIEFSPIMEVEEYERSCY